MTAISDQVRAQAEDSARKMATRDGASSISPYLAGVLEAKVDALALEIETANRKLADAQAENRRLEAIEIAAHNLLEAMGQAERRHRYGPLTTEEVREAEAHLTDVLEQDADGNK